jgi:hypothetical protein
MIQRSVQVGGGIVLALVLVACSGTSQPTTTPTSPPPTMADTATPTVIANSPPPSSVTDSPVGSPSSGPTIDPSALAAVLTSSLSVFDLTDGDLAVTVSYLDPSGGPASALGTYTLGASEQFSNDVPPGRYRFDFRQPATGPSGTTCTIDVPDQGTVTFMAVPGAVAVTRTGFTPLKAGDLFVATSLLCKP